MQYNTCYVLLRGLVNNPHQSLLLLRGQPMPAEINSLLEMSHCLIIESSIIVHMTNVNVTRRLITKIQKSTLVSMTDPLGRDSKQSQMAGHK